jgi:RNA polymerase sigma-70 factor, ECF subfamily
VTDGIGATAESVFREQSGRILATLIRISGSFDSAEEALQEAFASALLSWRASGLPANPAGWIMTVAHHKLIDGMRRQRTWCDKQDDLKYEAEIAGSTAETDLHADSMDFPDDRLRLIFTCCHPALNPEAQVALTLRTLGGLSTVEIAKAFLVPEATLAQRLVRAKRKIQEARIPYESPPPERLRERLSAVQAVVYLIFNEGYAATSGSELVRGEMCAEAIRLGRLLCELLPEEAENLGLLALMLLQDARRKARVRDGALVTLEEQDRSLWDRAAISEGSMLLGKALRLGAIGPYQLQAAIAALHAQAANSSETDWAQIAALYEILRRMNPSPVILLNQAVAVAMTGRMAAALERIDELCSGSLAQYYLSHAARADLLRRLGRFSEAAVAYRDAASLATNQLERDFLERRLRQMETPVADCR